MDTHGLDHAFGLTSEQLEATMAWDDDEGQGKEAVWPAYAFVVLCCVGILWYVFDAMRVPQ